MHGAPMTVRLAIAAAAIFAGASASSAAPAAKMGKVMLYVGTYTNGNSTSKGIYRYELDLATGALAPQGTPAETENPSFLALHPSGRFLYAVNETGESATDPSGGVSAFAVDEKTGALTFLNRQPSEGAAPCHVSVDKAGRYAFVANYAGGTVAVLPIGADGRLGPASSVSRHEGHGPKPEQKEPHPHSANVAPDKTSLPKPTIVTKVSFDTLELVKAVGGELRPGVSARAQIACGRRPLGYVWFHDIWDAAIQWWQF